MAGTVPAVVLAIGMLLVCCGFVAAIVLAPLTAGLAGLGAGRWWLSRWAQAGALLAVGAFVAYRTSSVLWPSLLVGFGAATLACLVDAASHRLPDVLTVRVGGVALVLTAVELGVLTSWPGAATVGVGIAVGGGALGLLALAYPPGMGLGDVKLGALLGGLVGAGVGMRDPAGAPYAGPLLADPSGAAWAAGGMLVAAFVLGGLVSVALLLTRRVGRRDPVPFGPFVLLGALIALAAGMSA